MQRIGTTRPPLRPQWTTLHSAHFESSKVSLVNFRGDQRSPPGRPRTCQGALGAFQGAPFVTYWPEHADPQGRPPKVSSSIRVSTGPAHQISMVDPPEFGRDLRTFPCRPRRYGSRAPYLPTAPLKLPGSTEGDLQDRPPSHGDAALELIGPPIQSIKVTDRKYQVSFCTTKRRNFVISLATPRRLRPATSQKRGREGRGVSAHRQSHAVRTGRPSGRARRRRPRRLRGAARRRGSIW